MSKPYDATGKELLETDPAGWAAFLGAPRPAGRVRVIDSDLATVTAAADKVLWIDDPSPWILHVEFQSAWDGWLPRRVLAHNAVLAEKYEVPVASVVVLLAPRAEANAITGRYAVAPPVGPAWEFAYLVVRVWELPPDRCLNGPLALAPFAPVADVPPADVPPADVPGVLLRVAARVRNEIDTASGEKLLTAIGLLLQLRYGAMATEDLMKNIPNLRDYAAFRVFVREGRVEGLRDVVLRQGRKKFGPPTPEQEAEVAALTDESRLEALSEKLLDVSTWAELLKPD